MQFELELELELKLKLCRTQSVRVDHYLCRISYLFAIADPETAHSRGGREAAGDSLGLRLRLRLRLSVVGVAELATWWHNVNVGALNRQMSK